MKDSRNSCRYYILIYRVARFYAAHFLEKQDEVVKAPFRNFEDNFLWVKTKSVKEKKVVGILEIDGFDISIYDDLEIQRCISVLQDIFKFSMKRLTILKTQESISVDKNISFYESFKKGDIAPERAKLLENYYDDLNRIETDSKINKYYLVIYENTVQQLDSKLNEIIIYLRSCRLESRVLPKLKVLNLVDKLNMLNAFEWSSPRNLDEDDFIYRHYRHKKIVQKPGYFVHDSRHYSVQAVDRFHFTLNPSWAKAVFGSESSVIWHIDDLDSETTRRLLNTSIINMRIRADVERNSVIRKQVQFEKEALEELASSIATGNNRIKTNSIFLLTEAGSKEELNKIKRTNERNVMQINCRLNNLIFQQISAFRELLLDGGKSKFSHEIPADTIAESWPFFTNSLNDNNLLLLGRTKDNNFLIWDQFFRDRNRKNFNMFILGTSGSGKSSLTKKILLNHLVFGHKVIVIDPEREYYYLTKSFKGSWIELGKGRNTSINPLHIRVRLENKESTLTNAQVIASHIIWIELWFRSLYSSFDEVCVKLLISFVTRLYKKWGLFSESIEISSLSNKHFPIISDLIKLIEEEYKREKSRKLEFLLLILRTDFEERGKYHDIYNNHTNISFDNDFLVFDVHNLYEVETNSSIKTAFLTILSLIQDQIVSNYNSRGDAKIVICIDEAHLLIDEGNPQILNYLIRTIKRIRKYKGGVILTTQNPGDFVGSPMIQNRTQAIINNMQYSAFLNMRSKDIEAVDKMFSNVGGLTDYEKKFLVTAQVGQCIFSLDIIKRFMLSINYNPLERKLIFKG